MVPVHVSGGGHVDGLRLGALVGPDAVNICVPVCVWTCFRFPWAGMQEPLKWAPMSIGRG